VAQARSPSLGGFSDHGSAALLTVVADLGVGTT